MYDIRAKSDFIRSQNKTSLSRIMNHYYLIHDSHHESLSLSLRRCDNVQLALSKEFYNTLQFSTSQGRSVHGCG